MEQSAVDLDAVVVNAVTRKVELDFAHVRFYRKFSFHVINYSIRLYFFSNFSSAIVWGEGMCDSLRE